MFDVKQLQFLFSEVDSACLGSYDKADIISQQFGHCLPPEEAAQLYRYFDMRHKARSSLHNKLRCTKLYSTYPRQDPSLWTWKRRYTRLRRNWMAKKVLNYEKWKPTLQEIYEVAHHVLSKTTVNSPLVKAYLANTEKGWKPPVWHRESWFCNSVLALGQQVHVSEDDPTMLAYTQNTDKLLRNIQTKIKPGRYLATFFGDVLDAKEIHYWANKQNSTLDNTYKLHLLDNNDPKWKGKMWDLMKAWRDAYSRAIVDYSCMAGHSAPKVYGLPGNHLGLVTWAKKEDPDPFENDNVRMYGRAIIRTDKKPNQFVRVFPFGDTYEGAHETALQVYLSHLGYEHGKSLEGIHLVRIDDEDRVVCPYIDGYAQYISLEDDTLIITANGDYSASNTNGYVDINEVDYTTCDCCGSEVDSDTLTYIDYGSIYVCETCLEDEYVLANDGRRRIYVPREDVYYCEDNEEYYTSEGLEYHGIQEIEYGNHRREFWSSDYVAITSRGTMHTDDAVYLAVDDADGNSYAHPDDVVMAGEGAIHQDDAITTVDGDTYHYENDALIAWVDENTNLMTYIHEEAFNPFHFMVLGNMLIYTDDVPERGAMTLREYVDAFSFVAINDLVVDKPLRLINALIDFDIPELRKAA